MNEGKENEMLAQENTEKAEDSRKKALEDACRKIMKIVIPCLCIMMVVLFVFQAIFHGSKEARDVKKALKSEGCDVKILTSSDDISEVLEEIDLEIKNVDELVVAVDKEDVEIFAFVFFCESRLDAEDVEEEIEWLMYGDPSAGSYRVERNAKAVCFGYVDLVEAAIEILD